MRKACILFIVAGFLLVFAGPVMADLSHYANPLAVGVDGEQVTLNYTGEGAGWNSGGPFVGTLYHADGTTDVWKTFCVEADGGEENFSPGATYKVWSTDLHTTAATGNYVTDAAKWLYYVSLHDTSQLDGYTGDLASDSYLQEAIWHGVWLSGTTTPLNMAFDEPAVTWFNKAVTETEGGKWAEADLVRVIDPADLGYTGTGTQAQSQLYEVDLYPVPEPSSLIVLSLGVLGLVGYARRRR